MEKSPKGFNQSYHIVNEIAAGGMGVVYKAYDTGLKRDVAIKLIKKNVMNEKQLKRFSREIEASCILQHPHIIKIYSSGVEGDVPYMVMELIDGLPLLEYLEKNRCSYKEKLILIKKIAMALDFAHKNKILHRDIKPSNIMVKADGEPVLMDFGLAKLNEVKDKSLTRTGDILGTPRYMAPEQTLGQKRQINHQSDTFSLGIVLYHILVGKLPFDGDNLIQIFHAIVNKTPLRLRKLDKNIPQGVEQICFKSLEKLKKNRYRSAKAFANDIEKFLQNKRTKASIFYQKIFYKKLLIAFSLCLMTFAMLFFVFSPKKAVKVKKDYFREMKKLYNNAKKNRNLHKTQIHLSIALDYLEKIKKRKNIYERWKTKLFSAIALNYYKQGIEKVGKPQEGKIYFLRALSYIPKQNNLRALRNKILHAFIRYQFEHKNYKSVLILAQNKKELYDNQETLWFITQASYLCKSPEIYNIIELFQKKAQKNDLRYLKSLYYKGILAIEDQQNYRMAEKTFESIWLIKKKYGIVIPFSKKFQLFYCYAILKNPENDLYLSKSKMKRLRTYLNNLEKNFKDSLVYKETRAGYFLRVGMEEGKKKKFAKKILHLMRDCISRDKGRSQYYYLRAVAYRWIGEYKKAYVDLRKALVLRPSHVKSVSEMLLLITDYSQNLDLFGYTSNIVYNVQKLLHVRIHLFASEFNTLRKQYHIINDIDQKIPFSQKNYLKFQNFLLSKSPSIRKLAENTIVSMSPSHKVLFAIKKTIQNNPKDVLDKLYDKVVHALEKRKLQKTFIMLTKINVYGNVSLEAMEFFYDKRDILKKILQDVSGKLALSDSDTYWVYMRFLAAKVLVSINDIALRREMIGLMRNPKVSLSTKILIAKALYEIGYVYFSKTFIYEKISAIENEFLQTLAAEMMKLENNENHKALKYLLHKGLFRASLVSAYHLGSLLSDPKDVEKFFSVFIQGHSSKNPYIQAYSINTIWTTYTKGQLFRNKKKMHKLQILLIKSLRSKYQIVRRAVLARLSFIGKYMKRIEPIKLGNSIVKIFKQSASRIEHYHNLLALGEFHHPYIKNDIIFNPNRLLFERIAGFLGISGKGTTKRSQSKNFIKKMTKAIMHDPSQRFRGIVLYALSKFYYLYTQSGGSLRLFLVFNIEQNLRTKNHLLLVYAMLSAINIEISAQIAKKLEYIWKHFPKKNLRKIGALSLLIAAGKSKSIRVKRCALRVKKRLLAGSDSDKLLIIMAYYILLNIDKETTSNTLHSMYKWNKRNLFLYSVNKLKFLSRHKRKRKKYLLFLEKAISLIATIKKRSKYMKEMEYELYYMYMTLLDMENRAKDVFRYILEMNKKKGWKNPFMMRLFAKTAIKIGKEQKLKIILKKLLIKLPLEDTGTIYGALGYIYLHEKKKGKAQDMFLKQYEIIPGEEIALYDLGEYYLKVGDYTRAYDVIYENHLKFIKSGCIYLQMSKLKALRGKKAKMIDLLKQARYEYGVADPKDLHKYKVFQPFLKERWFENFKKNWDNIERRR